ncbi:MAG: RecB family exonuclease, partial [Salibacteraceae bacterium]
LLQNALEWSKNGSNIFYDSFVLETSFNKSADEKLSIDKSDEVLKQIKRYLFESGLSPSALNVLLNNPMDFLLFHILGLREKEEVTFTIETSTIGTIVHDTLENLYKPYVGKFSDKIKIETIKPKINQLLNDELVNYYSTATLSSGRLNILIPVLKKWINSFVSYDLNGRMVKDFKLIDLEQKYLAEISYNLSPFKIKGIVDRVEIVNGIPHLIDYKTGKVEQKDLNLKSADLLELNPEKTKAYQLLFYTLLFHKSNTGYSDYTCSIYSFRNQKAGYINLKVDKSEIINSEILDLFEEGLKNTIDQLLLKTDPIRLENFRYQKFEV